MSSSMEVNRFFGGVAYLIEIKQAIEAVLPAGVASFGMQSERLAPVHSNSRYAGNREDRFWY